MLATPDQTTEFLSAFRHGIEYTYKKGEFIIRPGQPPSGVFYIKSGLVKAYDISKYGEENLLIIKKQREVFPLIWALTGQERHIIYEALAPSTLIQISRQHLVKAIHENPDNLVPLTDMLLEMYKIHSERILNLEYRTVRERLISFLIMMGDRFGRQLGDSIVIEAPLRQQDVASSINATRETTSREMAVLERQGLIINKSSIITLLEVKKLNTFI